MATGALLWEGRDGVRSASPDTGQQEALTHPRRRAMFAFGRGEAATVRLAVLLRCMTHPTLRALPRALASSLLVSAALPLAVPVAFQALAQTAGASAANALAPVVVVGTREAQPLKDSVADVVLIDAQTLRDGGFDSVEEALRRQAGLQITRNGGPGQTTGYQLRGTGTSSTVVMIDGVRVGSATLGQAAFESMSLSEIDHIEVLRGPASGLYGADAVGGVIQIFTRKGQGPLNLTGHVAVGDYRSSEADLAVTGAQGGFDYAASLSHDRSRGVSAVRPGDANGTYNPDDDGFRRTVASARLGFTPAAGHRIGVSATQSRLNAQYDGAQYAAPDFLPDSTPDFRNHLVTRQVAADYRGVISPLWTTTVQLARNTDDLRSGATELARFETDRNQLTWQNALRLSEGQQVVLGYERVAETVEGDVYADAPKRTNNGYFAGYTGAFGPASLEASLRSDHNSAYGTHTTGGLGASYALTSTLRLRALAGTSFRAPTFNDLYYPDYGVATLRPEQGRSIELGVNWTSGVSSASATVYRNKVRNLIGNDPNASGTSCPPGYFFGCASNVSRALIKGVSLLGAHRIGDLSLQATVDFLDARDQLTGARLPRRAAHQESVSVDYNPGVWSIGATLTDVGARPDLVQPLGDYALLDLRATWRFLPQWRLETRLLNATDRDVQPVRDYQGLGRQIWVGLRYDMKGF
ncbi:vitamin B12 transporter [Roseateles depolymerans]|uniref:Putative TonB-dependent vitamin B12 receptor n=2 Tax=Roseateles depolymerans TaxID=76731 RepID=A0A0U3LM26_9BURK|nr:Putative TonB-dependent vitamin B12 receptor [Roseateles depolymerans]REG13924.1 vitamin B12 transporter [Roseateles depolymerans]